jgi:betaine lipid synthase
VDVGGGTGENVSLMAKYMDLSTFDTIYIVDLCESLCDQARAKVDRYGWSNVVVVQADATQWTLPSCDDDGEKKMMMMDGSGAYSSSASYLFPASSITSSSSSSSSSDDETIAATYNNGSKKTTTITTKKVNGTTTTTTTTSMAAATTIPGTNAKKPAVLASLVTFSYSLSMMPNFHSAVDKATSYLDPNHGYLAVTDFYVSGKWDLPMRQMSWGRRFFWRSIFDMDGIDIGPERRDYLDLKMTRVWEMNEEGTIPWVPSLMKVPYYIWIGRHGGANAGGGGGGALLEEEDKVEAPPLFPPTFLYTQSWEDPDADEAYLRIRPEDVCLTLTSGGCNSLNLCLQGAKAVYSVDCNPAQSALLELKKEGIKRLHYEDFWSLFGEGRHVKAEALFFRKLAPFMTQTSVKFWKNKIHYFKDGLYYHGGMGKVVSGLALFSRWFGFKEQLTALAEAPTLEHQKLIWEHMMPIRVFHSLPQWAKNMVVSATELALFNPCVMWLGAGVPKAQVNLITKQDATKMSCYAARVLDGIVHNSHLKSENYFYYNCITGSFSRDNCPSYLKPDNFENLRSGRINALHIVNSFFLPALSSRQYDVAILMDHVDWLTAEQAKEVAEALGKQIRPGGRVIWRSAAVHPPYVQMIEDAGFLVRCVNRVTEDSPYLDRVNMYASFWQAVKKEN